MKIKLLCMLIKEKIKQVMLLKDDMNTLNAIIILLIN